jgi:hypothetical protein
MAMPTNVLALPLAHLVIEVANNEDWIDTLVFLVADSQPTPPYDQLDLRGISFEMHLRRRPEIHEIVLAASTVERSLLIGSPPNFGYLIFYVPEETMRTLWAGRYVGDIVARDASFRGGRVVLTIDLEVIEGITRS